MKYIAMGAKVFCRDGDFHWISAPEVMRLWGLDPKETILVRREEDMHGMEDFPIENIFQPSSAGWYHRES